MNIGDTVRIVEDVYPELVGMECRVVQMSDDGTAAWLTREGEDGISGVWCAVSQLELVSRA